MIPDSGQRRARIALVPVGDVIEEWLDPLGLSFEDFCARMDGGWMFGYVEALARDGIDTVLVCCSRTLDRPRRLRHEPTGAVIRAFPPPRRMELLARRFEPPPPGRLRSVRRRILWHGGWYLSLAPRALGQAVRAERCGAILCQEYETPRFDSACVVGRCLGLPVFGTFQGQADHVSRLEPLTRPVALRSAAGLVAPASAEARRVTDRYGLPAANVATIPNPLDTERWAPMPADRGRALLGIPPEAKVVVSHGRIDIADKGLDVLLAAWDRIVRERSEQDLRLVLVGSGGDADELRRILTARRRDDVAWVDEHVLDVDRLRELLCAGDVYAFAGRYEGFPVAPLEAMACGLPIVATDASGVPDILSPTGPPRGALVPRDDVDGLAAELLGLLDDPGRRQAWATGARRWVCSHAGLDVVGRRLGGFLRARGLRD